MDSKTIGLVVVAVVAVVGYVLAGYFALKPATTITMPTTVTKTVTSTIPTTTTVTIPTTITSTTTVTSVTTTTVVPATAAGLNSSSKIPVPTLYKQYSALGTVLGFLDAIAIESTQDVDQFPSSNFTAVISGFPFPGIYNYQSFNNTWLSNFFNYYETVYFYTTELPVVTMVSGSTYNVSAVVRFFVAPTNDPIYLQVINASMTAVVEFIHGKPLIVKLSWVGNQLPPSAVIAGYPSQHSMQANEALEALLWQINGMGAEFPGSATAQYFAPNAVLNVSGQLPPGLKAGSYSGISSIENFFNTWDSYFVFVAYYLQNLLPNGTAVPPSVAVSLSLYNATAVVSANDTVFLGWVAQGNPSYPSLYDMHVSIVAYMQYNSTTASWQIVSEEMNFTIVPLEEDTMSQIGLGPSFYGNTPALVPVAEASVQVNALSGSSYELAVGNIRVIIPPGTYVEANGKIYSSYNFTLVILAAYNIPSPPYPMNYMPVYAFAFEVDGSITPAITFINFSGKPQGIITAIYVAPGANWTSWTWLGGVFNGSIYIGGKYAFIDHWIHYTNGTMVISFIKPVPWIIEAPAQ